MPPLISEEEMDVMDYGDKSYDEPMSTEILEYIRDRSKSHLNINRRESRYKIHDRIRRVPDQDVLFSLILWYVAKNIFRS